MSRLGEGAIWRTVAGVLFIALIGNGSDLLGLNPLYDQIALGVILLLAAGSDAWSRLRGAAEMSGADTVMASCSRTEPDGFRA